MSDPFSAAASLGAAAIGAFSANASTKKQYKYQSRLMKQQAALNYEYAEKSARNTPTWNRAGLESAGYNPMLAVQNATSGANSNWTSGGSVNAPDYSGAMESGVNSVMSYINAKNQTSQTESQVKTNEATAENQRAEAANKRAENPYISRREEANLGKIGAETSKLDAETDHYKAAIENMKARLELDRKLGFAGIDVQREGNRISSYNAETARKNYNLYKDKFDASGDAWMKEFIEKHPHLYGAYRHLDNTAALAGRVFGAVPNFSSSSNYNDYETHSVRYDKHGNVVGQQTVKHHSNSGSKRRSKK